MSQRPDDDWQEVVDRSRRQPQSEQNPGHSGSQAARGSSRGGRGRGSHGIDDPGVGGSRDRDSSSGRSRGTEGRHGGSGRGQNSGYGGHRGQESGYRGHRGQESGYRGHRGHDGGNRGRHGYGGPSAGPSRDPGPTIYIPHGGAGKGSETVDQIQKIENELVKKTGGYFVDGFPTRSTYRESGSKISLRTNYFALEPIRGAESKAFYRFDVKFEPEPSKPKRRIAMGQILRQPRFANITAASNYSDMIITTKDLGEAASPFTYELVIEEQDPDRAIGQGRPVHQNVVQEPSTTFGKGKGKAALGSTQGTIQGHSHSSGQGAGHPPHVPPPKGKGKGKAPQGNLPGSAHAQVQSSSQGARLSQHVAAARDRNRTTATVSLVGAYSLLDLIQWVQDTTTLTPYAHKEDIITMLNIIIGQLPKTSRSVASVGANQYFPFDPARPANFNLSHGLDAQKGYFVSFRPAIGRILLNVNVTSRAFYRAIPVADLCEEFGQLANDVTDRQKLESFLRMLKIKVTYPTGVVKVKSIFGLAKREEDGSKTYNADEVSFSYQDVEDPNSPPRQTTITEYFRTKYGKILQRPDLSVLNVGTEKQKIWLPMEICEVMPGQPFRKFLDPGQTSSMITFAKNNPAENAESICGNGLRLFGLGNQNQEVEKFGFRIDKNLVEVPAWQLQTPTVQYRGNNVPQSLRPGTWNFTDMQFCARGRFKKFQALVVFDALPAEDTSRHVERLKKTLRDYQVTLNATLPTKRIQPVYFNRGDSLNARRRKMDAALKSEFEAAKRQGVDVLFVILPDKDKWTYSRVKYHGDVTYGIHTISSVQSSLNRWNKWKRTPQDPDATFFANLALKFNVKGGGVSHTVHGTMTTSPVDTHTMLVGIDVTHPSPGSAESAPSIACVVANTDSDLSQWPGSIQTQTSRKEMVEGLTDMMKQRLRAWKAKNGTFPKKVVVFRDGVSEGQFKLVLDNEFTCLKEAYTIIDEKLPQTTIVIVGKRHHTRFYPMDPAHADNTSNPKPGTLVDRGIAGKHITEFWLQPHQGLQGSVRPAHYSVIVDEIGFTAAQLQDFAHRLCYSFVRCTRAVSIPPPVYYADILAERGRAYLHTVMNDGSQELDKNSWDGTIHEHLKDSMFYV